jgi:tetratricopeptide (TPR) repeat protein
LISRPLVTVVAVAIALLGGLARADAAGQRKRGAAPNAQDEARELYKKGMTHYEIGAFDDAIVEFKRAYELTSAPGLLFNIAQVYRMKKDAEQALFFYRMYLRLMPDAPNRADVEALIVENQAVVDAKERAQSEAAAAPPPPAVVTPTAPLAAATLQAPPPPKRPWRVELWSGVGLAALGVGGLAAGIGLGARSASDARQISSANTQRDVPWDASKQKLYRDGQNSAIGSTVTYVVGGALAATGAVLVTLGLRDRARARATTAAAVAPTAHGATLVVTCAF